MGETTPMKTSPIMGLEKFHGNKGEFTMWKDKVLTHVNLMDQEYERGLVEKDLPEATVKMVHFLDGNPSEPDMSVSTKKRSPEEAKALRWKHVHWARARSGMQNLLNQALPNSFLSTLSDNVSKMDPCDIWKQLEQTYGLGDAAGLIELTTSWSKITMSNWKDLGSLFARLKKLRNDINRKTKALIGQKMVTESWLCVEVLAQLPSEFWASSISVKPDNFTLAQVEMAVRRVFGDKSKKDIGLLTDKKSSIGIASVKFTGKKRKDDNGENKCFYCLSEGHFKSDCPVKKADRDPSRPGGPLFRTDVRTAPGGKKAKTANTVKTKRVQKTAPAESSPVCDQTPLKFSTANGDMDEVEDLRYDGDVPMSETNSPPEESNGGMQDFDDEELAMP